MKTKITALLALSLSACGPIYDTRYSFIPPESQVGRACIYQCENGRQSCLQLEQIKYDNCLDRSRYEQERCQNQLEWEGKKEKWYDCLGESCSNDTDRCDQNYRSCYLSCGGDVKEENVCIANCDQAPRHK